MSNPTSFKKQKFDFWDYILNSFWDCLTSLSFYQYALRLLCVAIGVGVSAFIGKLHTSYLSDLSCRTQFNSGSYSYSMVSISNKKSYYFSCFVPIDIGFCRRNMLGKNCWETGFQNENGIFKISPKTRSWFLWHPDCWFFNNLPSCLTHLFRCQYNPSCLVWEGLTWVMPFPQTCLECYCEQWSQTLFHWVVFYFYFYFLFFIFLSLVFICFLNLVSYL